MIRTVSKATDTCRKKLKVKYPQSSIRNFRNAGLSPSFSAYARIWRQVSQSVEEVPLPHSVCV
jgi:hypothetical protein